MMSLKRRWDQKYPEENHVSKQNLRDNAVGFKKELAIMETRVEIENEGEQEITINNGSSSWTNEMKMNLLTIEEHERKRGRGFMKRMKEAWDGIYENNLMSAQTLGGNAVRFRKDKWLLSLIEIRDEGKLNQW